MSSRPRSCFSTHPRTSECDWPRSGYPATTPLNDASSGCLNQEYQHFRCVFLIFKSISKGNRFNLSKMLVPCKCGIITRLNMSSDYVNVFILSLVPQGVSKSEIYFLSSPCSRYEGQCSHWLGLKRYHSILSPPR